MPPTVREIPAGETALGAAAMLELRPQYETPERLVMRIDQVQRPHGYRLAGSFTSDDPQAAAVAGFRIVPMLACGELAIYVDDLVTRADHRREGHADALFDWLIEEAAARGCDELHLDSGVGPERANAHRFYFRHGMRVASYHFARRLL